METLDRFDLAILKELQDDGRLWRAALERLRRLDAAWEEGDARRRALSECRDWLSAHWDGAGAPPELPAEIVERTADKYRELLARLTA